jgi:hypothetical protein
MLWKRPTNLFHHRVTETQRKIRILVLGTDSLDLEGYAYSLCLCDSVGKWGLQDSSDDALGQKRHIEINQQAYSFVSELQVAEQLGLVNGQQFLHGF